MLAELEDEEELLLLVLPVLDVNASLVVLVVELLSELLPLPSVVLP